MRCALIPPTPTLDRMPANNRATGDREPRRYEIRVRGPIGPTTMQAFRTLDREPKRSRHAAAGSLPDQCALYGVIHQLEALGLQLLEIRRLPKQRRDDRPNHITDARTTHPTRPQAARLPMTVPNNQPEVPMRFVHVTQ